MSFTVLSGIRYTGHSASSRMPFWVQFQYGAFGSDKMIHPERFAIVNSELLREIKIRDNIKGVVVRTYTLDYDASPTSGVYLLKSLQVTAQKGTQTITLPEKTFKYSSVDPQSDIWGTSMHRNITLQGDDLSLYDNEHGFFDMNGDGYVDRVVGRPSSVEFEVYFGSENGFDGTSTRWSDKWSADGIKGKIDGFNQLFGFHGRIIDMNGDRLPDRVYLGRRIPIGGRKVTGFIIEINTGDAWAATQIWKDPLCGDGTAGCGNLSNQALLFDITGDGLPDRVEVDTSAPLSTVFNVYRNRGDRFDTTAEPWTDPVSPLITGVRAFKDMNGDHLPDRVLLYDRNGTAWIRVYPNVGDGWSTSRDYDMPDPAGRSAIDDYADLIDINHDGLADRVVGDRSTRKIRIYFNRGSRFETSNPLDVSDPARAGMAGKVNYGNYPGLIDLNGDGFLDRIVSDGNGGADVAFFRPEEGKALYLLREINNGLGVTTRIDYTPGSRFGNHLLPISLHVVTRISQREGSEVKTTDIRYAGGFFYPDYYNPSGSKFNGFNYVEVHDPLGNIQQKWYHQAWDGVVFGRLFVIPEHRPGSLTTPIPTQSVTKQDRYQGRVSPDPWGRVATSGRLYQEVVSYDRHNGAQKLKRQKTSNAWWTAIVGGSRSFVYRVFTEREEYATSGATRKLRQDWRYDHQTGNLTSKTDLAEYIVDPTYKVEYSNFLTVTIPSIGTLVTSKARTIEAKESNTVLRNRTTRVFDGKGNLGSLTRRLIDPSGPNKDITTGFTYDPFGNVETITDPLSRTTTFVYETKYNTYPKFERVTVSGTRFEIERLFDGTFGKVKKITTPDGRIWTTKFDPLGRVTQRSLNLRWVEKYEYVDRVSRPGATGQFLTAVRRFTFLSSDPASSSLPREVTYRDGQGRVVLKTVRSERSSNEYRAVSFSYRQDRQNHISYQYRPRFVADSSFVSGAGPYTAGSRDSLGRVTRVTPPAGDTNSPTAPRLTSYSYQNDPWTTVLTDEMGKIKRQKRNGRGQVVRLIEVAAGQDIVTRYKYDFWGNRTEIRDANNDVSTQVFDNLGRKVRENNMDRGTWGYKYDDGGNLIQQTDARGVVTALTNYDALNRPGARTSSGPGVTTETVTFRYDTAPSGSRNRIRRGELAEIIDDNGYTRFSYNASAALEKVERTISGLTGVATTEYDRDRRGLVKEMKYPGRKMHLKYDYDRSGGINKVTRLGSKTQELYRIDSDSDYDAMGHLKRSRYGNGVVEVASYYPLSQRLFDLKQVKGAERLRQMRYQYNAAGNATTIDDMANRSADINDASLKNIQYDDLHRVTGYSYYQGAASRLMAETYVYDDVGNLTENGDTFGALTYTYNNANHAHAVSSIGNDTFSYDVNGNMTVGRGRTLSYGPSNRLTKVDLDNNMDVEYTYGGLGERLSKKVTSSDGSTSTTTFFMGNYLEIKDGLLVHNIYVENKLIATIGEQWTGTTISGVSPGWNWQNEILRDFVYTPSLALVGFIVLVPVARRRRKLTEAFVETFQAWGLDTGRKITAAVLIVGILSPSTALAYVFPSDVEDTWPPPSQVFFLYIHVDHLRSSNLMTEGQKKTTHNGIRFIEGEVVQRVEYTPFGKERYVLNPTLRQTPKFTDQVYDVEDGLYFYQSRYYDAAMGRFIQPDNWTSQTGNPQTINAYSYVLNNPLKYIDPTGHYFIDVDGQQVEVSIGWRDSGEETILPEIVVTPDDDYDDDYENAGLADRLGGDSVDAAYSSNGTVSNVATYTAETNVGARRTYYDPTLQGPEQNLGILETVGLLGNALEELADHLAKSKIGGTVLKSLGKALSILTGVFHVGGEGELIGGILGGGFGFALGAIAIGGTAVLGAMTVPAFIAGAAVGIALSSVGAYIGREYIDSPHAGELY